MPATCQSCSVAAVVYCGADAAWLCGACDLAAHSGPLSCKHQRTPVCAVCNEQPSSLYCRNDTAYLCSGCSDACHAGLPLQHSIIPAAQAVKEGLAPTDAHHASCEDAHHAEFSACGESSPAAAPVAGAKRRLSEDSAQRVPEFDATAVPPGLDYELPKGQPMDKQALVKSIWGKDLESFEMDNTWLDRLDMGFDFADDMLADLPINTMDGLVPSISDDAGMVPGAGLPTTPTAAAIEQQLAEPTPKSLAAAVPQQQLQQDALQAPLLATLERQSTDEFFASLADDFAVPSMAAHELPSTVPAMMHVPSAAPQQPAMVPMVPQQQATFYPQQAAMYMAPQPAVVPQLVPIPLPAPSAAATPAPSALTQPPLPKRQRRAVFEDSDEDEDDDDEEWRHDEEFAGAPSSRAASRAGAASASSAAAAAAAAAAPIDNLTREQRVARYREKRKNRQFKKTIRYASRKAYAEVRPRIKGRFAKKEELEAWRAAERAMAAGAAAAGMALPEGFGFAFGEAPGVVPVM